MDLARHTDVNLTLARYSHTRVEDRARALEALPELRTHPDQESLRATGTADRSPDLSDNLSEKLAAIGKPLVTPGKVGKRRCPKDGTTERPEKPNKHRGMVTVGQPPGMLGKDKKGEADGGIRTHDPSFTKAVADDCKPLESQQVTASDLADLSSYMSENPDLAQIVTAWPHLPANVQRAILALAEVPALLPDSQEN